MKMETQARGVPSCDYYLYKHTSPNQKVYIGITRQLPEKRFQNGKGYRHNDYFNNAILKYGWENFKHEIIEENLSRLEAERKEIELIAKYKSNNKKYGYNITSGGETTGKHSAKSIEKMRKALKGKKTRLGCHHTEEAKKKLSESHKGMQLRLGIKHTEDTKEKMRRNHADFKGENSPRHRKKHSLESKIKISQNRAYKTGKEHPQSKAVEQFSLDGSFIRLWDSVSSAMREFKQTYSGSIKPCCQGKTKTAYGFIWKYKEVA